MQLTDLNNMTEHKIRIFYHPGFVAGILVIIVIAISAQRLLLEPKSFEPGGIEYTNYNNFKIFKQSYFHLTEGKDLYQAYPAEHWDYYKYSPAFALLMAPLALLPDSPGLTLWNLLNALVLFFALWSLGKLDNRKKLLVFALVIIELITSLQNSQSNGLIAGLVIIAFNEMEKGRAHTASLFIVTTVFIKIFGIVALLLFVFYPRKLQSVLYTAGWVAVFFFLPLLVTSWPELKMQYESWLHLLQNDHSASTGLSVAGWLSTWFGVGNKNLQLATGAVLLLLPLIRLKFYKYDLFRLLYLSSVLVWMVIFNHKAESPTFVIAVSGVAIWFFMQKFKIENLVLLILVIFFTILSPTDIFPASFRSGFIQPYVLKAVPCILVWIKITIDLLFFRPGESKETKLALEKS